MSSAAGSLYFHYLTDYYYSPQLLTLVKSTLAAAIRNLTVNEPLTKRAQHTARKKKRGGTLSLNPSHGVGKFFSMNLPFHTKDLAYWYNTYDIT